MHQSNKLEPDARNNPYNHGCGETEVHVKAIVDTFPFVMHDRSPGHYAPKYKKAVMKFQIDVTFLGRIARLSRWYEGSVHDGTIYEDNFDGEPVVGDKAYIGKPLCVTASRGQVSPAQELRNQVLPPLPLPHLLTIACLTLPPAPPPLMLQMLNHFRVRVEHIIGRIKRHGLFRAIRQWRGHDFAAACVRLVVQLKSLEIRFAGDLYAGNGPWAH